MLSLFPRLFLLASLPFIATASLIRHDTGCDMTPGSLLMQCLGSYASVPPVPSASSSSTDDSLLADAMQLCAQYSQIADCWARGLYCAEWLPLMIDADKICFIASSASSASQSVATSVFSSVTAEASRVVTSIWNNDVGTAIPSVSQDLVPSTTYPSGTHISPSATGGDAAGVQTAAVDRASAANRNSGRFCGDRAAFVAMAGAAAVTVLTAFA